MEIKGDTQRRGELDTPHRHTCAHHCSIHGHHADGMGKISELVEEMSLTGQMSVCA